MVGLLISMVCIVVLFAILMNSMNKAVTGQGSAVKGTVRSFEDELTLTGLYQSMLVNAGDNKGQFLTPGELGGRSDAAKNTTANLYSAMVMEQYTSCKALISANEYSGYVQEKLDYNHAAYNPSAGVFWDPTFVADLARFSNVSYAHMPLCGERFRRKWQNTMDSSFPLVGNRGPKDGVNDPNSWTYGRNGQWGGHFVFGDGHVQFRNSFDLSGHTLLIDGQSVPDNVFNMQSGFKGDDAILSFTEAMSGENVKLQYD
jgi:hypothetical protein